jgi:uncharacterized protein YndB with AHSA1/START domain
MSETIEVTRVIPAKPERVFNAWLSGDEHGLMTSSTATYDESTGEFTAWDGYISGKTLEKDAARRIVQSWRTTEFPEGAPDSKLEVRLEEVDEGTKVTLVQTEVPDGQGESYEVGWSDHYFDPMTDYFQSARSKIKDAGIAVTEAAEKMGEQVSETLEAAGEEVQKAAEAVQKSAKKASKQVKKLVQTAKKKIQAASRKATKKKPAPKKAKLKAKAKKAAPKKKVAPKKKAAKAKAKKRR